MSNQFYLNKNSTKSKVTDDNHTTTIENEESISDTLRNIPVFFNNEINNYKEKAKLIITNEIKSKNYENELENMSKNNKKDGLKDFNNHSIEKTSGNFNTIQNANYSNSNNYKAEEKNIFEKKFQQQKTYESNSTKNYSTSIPGNYNENDSSNFMMTLPSDCNSKNTPSENMNYNYNNINNLTSPHSLNFLKTDFLKNVKFQMKKNITNLQNHNTNHNHNSNKPINCYNINSNPNMNNSSNNANKSNILHSGNNANKTSSEFGDFYCSTENCTPFNIKIKTEFENFKVNNCKANLNTLSFKYDGFNTKNEDSKSRFNTSEIYPKEFSNGENTNQQIKTVKFSDLNGLQNKLNSQKLKEENVINKSIKHNIYLHTHNNENYNRNKNRSKSNSLSKSKSKFNNRSFNNDSINGNKVNTDNYSNKKHDFTSCSNEKRANSKKEKNTSSNTNSNNCKSNSYYNKYGNEESSNQLSSKNLKQLTRKISPINNKDLLNSNLHSFYNISSKGDGKIDSNNYTLKKSFKLTKFPVNITAKLKNQNNSREKNLSTVKISNALEDNFDSFNNSKTLQINSSINKFKTINCDTDTNKHSTKQKLLLNSASKKLDNEASDSNINFTNIKYTHDDNNKNLSYSLKKEKNSHEKIININHNFNHNINHNILINIENSAAKPILKSLDKVNNPNSIPKNANAGIINNTTTNNKNEKLPLSKIEDIKKNIFKKNNVEYDIENVNNYSNSNMCDSQEIHYEQMNSENPKNCLAGNRMNQYIETIDVNKGIDKIEKKFEKSQINFYKSKTSFYPNTFENNSISGEITNIKANNTQTRNTYSNNENKTFKTESYEDSSALKDCEHKKIIPISKNNLKQNLNAIPKKDFSNNNLTKSQYLHPYSKTIYLDSQNNNKISRSGNNIISLNNNNNKRTKDSNSNSKLINTSSNIELKNIATIKNIGNYNNIKNDLLLNISSSKSNFNTISAQKSAFSNFVYPNKIININSSNFNNNSKISSNLPIFSSHNANNNMIKSKDLILKIKNLDGASANYNKTSESVFCDKDIVVTEPSILLQDKDKDLNENKINHKLTEDKKNISTKHNNLIPNPNHNTNKNADGSNNLNKPSVITKISEAESAYFSKIYEEAEKIRINLQSPDFSVMIDKNAFSPSKQTYFNTIENTHNFSNSKSQANIELNSISNNVGNEKLKLINLQKKLTLNKNIFNKLNLKIKPSPKKKKCNRLKTINTDEDSNIEVGSKLCKHL